MSEPDQSSKGVESPLPGRLLGLLHAAWVLALGLQIAGGWERVWSAPWGHLFLVGGVLLMVAGTPLLLAINGAGWVFLFLGNICIILHFLQGLFSPALATSLGVLGSALLSAVFLGLLCRRQTYLVFAGKELRLWTRSQRFPVQLEMTASFHGHEAQVCLGDLSRTGCSFDSEARLPVGELVCLGNGDAALPLAQVIRRTESSGGVKYRYGVRFRTAASAAQLAGVSAVLLRPVAQPEDRSQRQ